MSHADYLRYIVRPHIRTATVNRVAKALKRIKREGLLHFDNIAFRGESGAGIGYPVATRLELPVTICRKHTKDNHSNRHTEYLEGVCDAVLIDDLVCTGDTMHIMIEQLKEADIKPAAIVLYTEWSSKPHEPVAIKWHNMRIPVYAMGVNRSKLREL